MPGAEPPADQIDATTLLLGFRYSSNTVEDPHRPSGTPGTRAPHIALRDGRSLLDLFDPTRFTVIGDGDASDQERATGAHVVHVARNDVSPDHHERWDLVYSGNHTVVRPDGVIAERRPTAARA